MHRRHPITRLEIAYLRAHFDDNAGRFVTGDDREALEREAAVAIDEVAVADAARLDAEKDAAGGERIEGRRDALVHEIGVPAALAEVDALADRDHERPILRAISSRWRDAGPRSSAEDRAR